MTMQNKRQLAVALAMMWMALTTQAIDYAWQTDIGSGNWSDPANWSPAGVPGISDLADFTEPQSAPFTVSFTNDAASRLSLGSTDVSKPVKVTFDLNGHTLTHTNSDINVYRALDWTILDGTLRSYANNGSLRIGDYQVDYVPKVTIGAGAAYLHSGISYIRVGSQSAGELVIQDGGKLITQSSDANKSSLCVGIGTFTGYTNYTARLTVTGSGSVWSNLVGTILIATNPKAEAELNVTDNGLLVHNGEFFAVGVGSGANGSLTIASGGVVDNRQSSVYMSIGNYGTGTVTVTGSGSKLLLSNSQSFYFGNRANESQGTLIIEKGGVVEKMIGDHSLYLGYRDNATGRLIVRDGGVLRWAGGSGNVWLGRTYDATHSGIGEMTVTGSASRAIIGALIMGWNYARALVTVAEGGTLEVYRSIAVGLTSLGAYNDEVKLVVTGTGSVLKKSALTKSELPSAYIEEIISLGIGSKFWGWNDSGLVHSSGYQSGCKALTVIENGGQVEINGTVAVFPDSTLRIDGGRMHSDKIGLDTNAVFNTVLRSGDANGTALMTATGEVRIWGATLAVEKGLDFVPVSGDVYTLITADALNSTINRFSYDGSVLQDGDLIRVEGTPFKVGYTANAVTLTVRNNGTVIFVL
ncbi:MAG: hypothetical protein WC340_15990 [Kiritimatiellia bacterium]